ncbi:MAG: hypothetical protein HGA45_29305, partial [Chloroflexales bacterium]|nr:hypothetical protein [Chloroflexales bacterium]
MAADPSETPAVRRGKGLRLSTQPPEDTAPAPTPSQDAPAHPAETPAARRKGLRLSTQPPEDTAPAPAVAPRTAGARWRIG